MRRFIPALLVPLFLASGIGLWLYGDLSPEDRAKADKIAADYAAKLYHKAVSELSRAEAKHVQTLTRLHFAS